MRKTLILSQLLLCSGGGLATAAFAQNLPPTLPNKPAASNVQPGAQQVPPVSGAPIYTPVRWNEDYRYLADESKRADLFDPVKYIPLGPDDWYLSLGAQARYRYEYFDEFNFGDPFPQDDDGYHLTRFMGHADLHLGENVRGFVQFISAHISDRDGGPRVAPAGSENSSDRNDFDVHQAFVDVILPIDKAKIVLRGGRQNLLYGAQRLISPLDWTNTRRTFDGGKISITCPQNVFDIFWVQPVTVDKDDADDRGHGTDFAGIYDTVSLPDLIEGAGAKIDAYALYLDREALDEERYTVGGRFYANPKPIDFDVEAAYQFGDLADADISAWMFAAEAGYTFADASLSPRMYLGFDIASGDDDPGNTDAETFNQLFPLGHAYFGYIDVVGRQNIIDLHPGASIKPHKDMKLSLDYHMFWREADDDALYNAGGAPLRPAGGSTEKRIGSEIDLLLTWQVDRHLLTYFGYSHFFPGQFIEDTGDDEAIDFVYVAVQYTF
jgi:hypothetical protein